MLGASQGALLGAAGCLPIPATYPQRVWSKHPAWYLPLWDTEGAVAAAQTGPDATYLNAVQLGVDPLAQEDAFGGSVGLNGLSVAPSHLTSTSPLSGPDLTIDLVVQFDTLEPAKQILVTGPASADGTFGLEVLQDGRTRAYSQDDGTFSEIIGSVGDVRQGTAHKITYQRQSGATPSQRILVDGIVVAADPILRTWTAVPPGAFYIGAWSNGAAPFDGLIAHVAGWNRYLSQVEINDLVRLVDSVAWAEDIDAGTILPNDSKTISVKSGGWHGKIPLTAMAGDGSLVTTTESADQVTVNAGATKGVDSFTYWFKDANNNISPTRVVSVSVPGVDSGNEHDALVMAAPGQISNEDLQAADAYYWSAEITDQIRNDWNNRIAPDRQNFESQHPTTSIDVNAKTRIYHPSGVNHAGVIHPGFPDEVLVQPSMSQNGVLRLTSRNKAGWNYLQSANGIRNFRKHQTRVRIRKAHSAYVINNRLDHILHNQTYEAGFTFWFGGTNNALFTGGGAGALFQVHGDQACIYFQISSTKQFSGFTRPSPRAGKVYFPTFPMTTGHNDIHVLRFRYRLGSNGFFTVWYNGVQQVNVSRTISPGPTAHDDILLLYRNPIDGTKRNNNQLDSNNGHSPSVAGGSTIEGTIYADRIWRKAL